MDLRRIRHFNVLAETLNFSRAAERLHIAQPALSVSIQKLEAELGTRLFERTPSGVVLTPSGQSALVEARRLLYHGEQLLRTARDAASGYGGRLRIGFVGSSIYRVLPTLIPAVRHQYPGLELVLSECTSSRILVLLREEALDVGIVRTPLLQPHGATLHVLHRDRFVAAMPAAHPMAGRKSFHLKELAGEPFVMYTAAEAAGLHASALAACEAAGFAPEVTQEATQVATVLALVASGLGVALVPEVVRSERTQQVRYVDLLDESQAVETSLALAWHADSGLPAVHRFVEASRGVVFD